MGNLYFYDKVTDKFDFIFDWEVRQKRRGGWMSDTCVIREMSDDIERITGWECNEKLFDDYAMLAFNGKMKYGKRGMIYDIDNPRNSDIALRVKRIVALDKILDTDGSEILQDVTKAADIKNYNI